MKKYSAQPSVNQVKKPKRKGERAIQKNTPVSRCALRACLTSIGHDLFGLFNVFPYSRVVDRVRYLKLVIPIDRLGFDA